MDLDEDRLRRGLQGLRSLDVSSAGVVAALNEVVATVPSVLDVAGSGLMMIDGDLVLHAVAWSDEASLAFEAVQEETGRGPCVDSLLHDTVVRVTDVCADDRWPDVTAAVAPLGVRAVLGVPVHIDGENVGALNVYVREAHDWTDEDVAAVSAFATVLQQLLGVAVLAGKHEDVVAQLQQALDSRVVIERAVGVVMGRRDLGAVEAFNLMRSTARRERRRVFEVAAEVLEGRTLD